LNIEETKNKEKEKTSAFLVSIPEDYSSWTFDGHALVFSQRLSCI
jgi:hypothetical protein